MLLSKHNKAGQTIAIYNNTTHYYITRDGVIISKHYTWIEAIESFKLTIELDNKRYEFNERMKQY